MLKRSVFRKAGTKTCLCSPRLPNVVAPSEHDQERAGNCNDPPIPSSQSPSYRATLCSGFFSPPAPLWKGVAPSHVTYEQVIPTAEIHETPIFSSAEISEKPFSDALNEETDVSPETLAVPTDQQQFSRKRESDQLLALTEEQSTVLQLALDGASLFIGGKAGTGKSFLLREVARRLRDAFGLRVAVTAATGVAALNIDGNTFHSTFGLAVTTLERQDASPRWNPITSSLSSVHTGARNARRANIRLNGADTFHAGAQAIHFRSEALTHTDVIVIDEVSLLHAGYLEALERAARRAPEKDPRKPFGGIQVILSGDFMQLTPFGGIPPALGNAVAFGASHPNEHRLVCRGVSLLPDDAAAAGSETSHGQLPAIAHRVVKRRYRVAHYTTLPLYESYMFQHALLHAQLTEPYRQRSDMDFVEDLNRLRCGELPYRLSRCALLNKPDDSAIRLFATKNAVKTFNERKMLELPGEERVFRSELHLRPASGQGQGNPSWGRMITFGESATEAKNRNTNSRPHADGGTRRHCSDTAMLHLTKRHRGCGKSSRFRQVPVDEAKRLLAELCTRAGLTTDDVVLYPLPFAFSVYAANVSSVAVRCSGPTRHVASARLAALLRAAHAVQDKQATTLPSTQRGRHSDSREDAPTKTTMSSRTPEWQLLRCEQCSTRQLLSALQPTFQNRFRKMLQSDFVFQNKILKVGCRVMLLRNLNQKYVNGSIGTIVAFSPLSACRELIPTDLKVTVPRSHHCSLWREEKHVASRTSTSLALSETDRTLSRCPSQDMLPIVQFDSNGRLVAIPWVTLVVPALAHEHFFTGKVTCMPLTPAYAFTVHKIQGVTLDHPILFDGTGMFPCDHLLYVVASRVKRFEQLRWVNVSPRMITIHQPSLAFSQGIPTVRGAERMWRQWSKIKCSSASTVASEEREALAELSSKSKLFYPSWRRMS